MTAVTDSSAEAGSCASSSARVGRPINLWSVWALRQPWSLDVPLAVRLRLALAAGCAALAFVQHTPWVMAGAFVMALTELAGGRWWASATAVQALLAAATVLGTSAQGAAALPLLIVAAFRAGERGRMRDVVATVALTAAATAAGWYSLAAAVPVGDLVVDTLQWLTLAAGVGLLQAVSVGRAADSLDVLAAREAASLATQLTELARSLPNGLHAPAVAEALLEAAVDPDAAAPIADRAAVLVRRDEQVASPLAVRGSHRVPWRDPVRSEGTPARAWRTRTTVSEVRPADVDGRRRGSAMLCVPLLDAGGELLGLLVLERLAPVAFDADARRCAERAAARYSPHLQAALLFGELQLVATISERERLAREMHDGIAQDLVALAFSLELLGRQLRDTSPTAEQSVRRVRGEVTRLVRDIRFSIADLRSSVRPERGLGAALSSQVQAMATATGLTMHLSLRESTFRLPAQLETAYLRVAQSVLHDVRCDPSAHEVWLSLEVEPPGAELVVRHDGERGHDLENQLVEQLGRLGVSVSARVGELRVASGLPEGRIPGPRSGADR
jgi:signal transduction histidine kinase